MVVFSGGGTGGHLYPALALADALRRIRPDVQALFVGASRGIEARVLPNRGEEHLLLPVVGFSRSAPLWKRLGALLPLGRALAGALGYLRRHDPAVVVVTGGYAGAPTGLGAVLLGIPLVIQEQNAEPGLVTRVLSRWARRVHLAFPEAADRLPARVRERIRVSGNPVRAPDPVQVQDRDEARRAFDLAPDLPVVLVVGGSQGAAALNDALVEAARLVDPNDVDPSEPGRGPEFQILWSTGPAHLERVRARLGRTGGDRIRVFGYIDDMPSALAAADLAVSRAGAMATSEFLAWGLPAILVPLPGAAADHQTRNAVALEDAGAAIHLPQDTLSGATLLKGIRRVLSNGGERLDRMARAARERGRPDAAEEIARSVAELIPSAGDPA